MMAFDRTPTQPSLDPETIAALRTTLRQSATQGTHGDELHTLLCRAANEARTKGIQAEQLLVVLKDVWHGLPEIRSAAGAADQERALLQQLISRCIQEYYAL
jgi:hypothetical protein